MIVSLRNCYLTIIRTTIAKQNNHFNLTISLHMTPSTKIQAVIEFVTQWHLPQKRKFTGEPYVTHLIDVYKTVSEVTKDKTIHAAALCHDLYEDTDCSETQFVSYLLENGFDKNETKRINSMVFNLTDVYVKDHYPHLNRKKRKNLEAKRLANIQPDAQTVKYADMIDNSKSIVKDAPRFAGKYLYEMKDILQGMNKGDAKLYKRALKQCEAKLKKLQN